MPDPRPTGDRTPAQRQADHASLGRLSESLVPALVQKLASSGLGELEVREGDWRIRLRRASSTAAPAPRRTERPRLGAHGDRDGRARDGAGASGGRRAGRHEQRRCWGSRRGVGANRGPVASGRRVPARGQGRRPRAGRRPDRGRGPARHRPGRDVADRRHRRRRLPPGGRGGRVRGGGRRRRVRGRGRDRRRRRGRRDATVGRARSDAPAAPDAPTDDATGDGDGEAPA